VPDLAVRWYERALKAERIDSDTDTAIRFELACACDAAGDRSAALRHFMEVYGTNIDYRDVAERIKALRS
jgi:thioredoxin-like negative regulator of GroEL